MQATPFPWVIYLKELRFWLLGIAAGLAAIQLTLTWRADNTDLLGSSILFFVVIGTLLKEKQHQLTLESSFLPSCLGTLLIGFVLLRSLGISSQTFLQLSPFVAGCGLAMLASGFRGFKQYAKELLILFCLGAPQTFIPPLVDTTAQTAKFATLLLWYSGFEVVQQGMNIQLSSGAVEVYPGCSGIESISYLLSLAGLFLAITPLNWFVRGLVPVVAIAIAFVINAARVALMAFLVNSSQPEAFKYWHEGDGSLIFSMISVAIFGGFCWLVTRQAEAGDRDEEESWEAWEDVEIQNHD